MRNCIISRTIMVAALFALTFSTPVVAHQGDPVERSLEYSSLDRTVIHFEIEDFERQQVAINGRAHTEIALPGCAYVDMQNAGQPRLPMVTESLMIPDTALMKVTLLNSKYHEIEGMEIAPSKGTITRNVDPATVPHVFGPEYSRDAFFPSQIVHARDPYILRDVRGMVVEVYPFQYNPVTKVLRIYTHIEIEVKADGVATKNILDRSKTPHKPDRTFEALYLNQFSNSGGNRGDPPSENGDMLVISHGPFMAAMQPFVDWKNSIGINTTMVDVASIGNNSTAIKNHITNAYNTSNLAYVLLVGDHNEVKSPSYGAGLSDPTYSTITADWYPDIFVGRFSCQNVDHVNTMVNRSIAYEQEGHDISMGGWNTYGLGVASNQGSGIGHYGESDDKHMDLIRDELLAYGFSKVDRVYDYFGTKAMITSGINEGRRSVNYCGHGSTTSWGTTGFSNNDVNQLQNSHLPFICSVACVNGDFSYGACFAEAWMRATHLGQPSGAVACYMSTVNQSWAPPMYGQGNHTKSNKFGAADRFWTEMNWSIGGEWFGGSCCMMDLAGTSGRSEFMNWTVFGDPSLRVLGTSGEETLKADGWALPINSGTDIHFTVCPGTDFSNYNYVVLTGATGSQPGSTMPNGLEVPLNFDAWTYFALGFLNTPTFADFYGQLDVQGEATATFSTNALVPIKPRLVGAKLYFCAVLWPAGGGYDMATNTKILTITE